MKKVRFPNCIKIYNKTLASDIISISIKSNIIY